MRFRCQSQGLNRGLTGCLKITPNVTRGLNRAKLPFGGGSYVGRCGHLVVIGGQDCKLSEDEGHGENRVRMTALGMPQIRK